MGKVEKVSSGWGSFLKFKILTDVRAFDQVEKALLNSTIQDHHGSPLLERPKASTAFTRSMGYLTRVCASSIPFPPGSPNAEYDEGGTKRRSDRNPNFSLKVEAIKGTSTDGTIAYRVNISDRRLDRGNMSHVLTAVYKPDHPVSVEPGDDLMSWDKFGEDLTKLVNDSYFKFFHNYDDTDVRAVVDKELDKLKAVRVLGYTTNFISKDTPESPNNTERAVKLVEFIRETGHLAGLLGLDASDMTRDQIVEELKSSIISEMDEYEAELDRKLNSKTKERQRGEKQRERMLGTAEKTIDRIMGLAEYHTLVLGNLGEGIRERAEKIRAKAHEFLTRDFGSGVPLIKEEPPTNDLAKRVAELEAENARLKGFQGIVVPEASPVTVAPVEAPATPKVSAEQAGDAGDPFGAVTTA